MNTVIREAQTVLMISYDCMIMITLSRLHDMITIVNLQAIIIRSLLVAFLSAWVGIIRRLFLLRFKKLSKR